MFPFFKEISITYSFAFLLCGWDNKIITDFRNAFILFSPCSIHIEVKWLKAGQ